MLCDRFLADIANAYMQRWLLAEPDLTFKKAFELTLSMEMADKATENLQNQNLHTRKKNTAATTTEPFSS